jgi:hypothetical protein
MHFLSKMRFLFFTIVFIGVYLNEEWTGDLIMPNCRIKNESRFGCFGFEKFIPLLPGFITDLGNNPLPLNRSIVDLMNFG